MSSKGMEETELLKSNLNDQLQRLLIQLKDIEECKDELDADDYEEARADTVDQLQELNERISKMMAGDITLVDHFSAMQMATASAISAAFRTPEVKQMFAKQQPAQLRQRIEQLERDAKLGHINAAAATRQKVEILSTLRQLGEKLSATELQLIAEKEAAGCCGPQQAFLHITDQTDVGEKALDLARMEAKSLETP